MDIQNPPEIPVSEDRVIKTLSKDKLDSLKKARAERTKKVKELNDKQLNIVNSLTGIYDSLSTLDSRISHLDQTIRNAQFKRSCEHDEEHQQRKVQKTENASPKKDGQAEHSDSESEYDIETAGEDGTETNHWRTMLEVLGVFGAFFTVRLAANYCRETLKDHIGPDRDVPFYNNY